MEKIRPLSKRVQYSVDKLVSENGGSECSMLDLEKKKHGPRPAAKGVSAGGGERNDDNGDDGDDGDDLKSALKTMKSSSASRSLKKPSSSSSSSTSSSAPSSTSAYQPPKLNAVSFSGGGVKELDSSGNPLDSDDDNNNNNNNNGRKRKLRTQRDFDSLHAMSDLVRSASGAPEVAGTDGVSEGRASGRYAAKSREGKAKRDEEEKTKFEEERFVRIVESKKGKKKRKKGERSEGGLKSAFGV